MPITCRHPVLPSSRSSVASFNSPDETYFRTTRGRRPVFNATGSMRTIGYTMASEASRESHHVCTSSAPRCCSVQFCCSLSPGSCTPDMVSGPNRKPSLNVMRKLQVTAPTISFAPLSDTFGRSPHSATRSSQPPLQSSEQTEPQPPMRSSADFHSPDATPNDCAPIRNSNR